MMSEEESDIHNSKQISKMLNGCVYIYIYICGFLYKLIEMTYMVIEQQK